MQGPPPLMYRRPASCADSSGSTENIAKPVHRNLRAIGCPNPSANGCANLEDMGFRLAVNYQPRGDQENAIAELTRGIRDGEQHQVLLGVTGSGKTFTMAKVIEATNHPALVLAHN